MASAAGRRIVEMVWEDLKPTDRLARQLLNAVVADMALSGSTNSLIHLIAMARRLGIALGLDDFSAGENVPVLCNLQPSGKYLMEDFYYAGGMRALLAVIRDQLDLGCLTVTGRTLGEEIADAVPYDDEVIRPLDKPVYPAGGLVVLRGNLAPRGAVLKRAAADPKLMNHTGPAVVFENFKDMLARIDDPDLPVTADSVLVLRDAGPTGGPGMPEWGMIPIPKKLLKEGVRDMLRSRRAHERHQLRHLHPPGLPRASSAARWRSSVTATASASMSTPANLLPDESRDPPRRLDAAALLRARLWRLFVQHVLQADEGCDLDFLAKPGATPEPEARFS